MKKCSKCNTNNSDKAKFCFHCGAALDERQQERRVKKDEKFGVKDGIGCVIVAIVFGGISFVANEILHLHGCMRLLFGIGCIFAIAMIFGLLYGVYLHLFHKD